MYDDRHRYLPCEHAITSHRTPHTTHRTPHTGIMVTSKKRQEFRIKLQKRARRRAERKVDGLEDDKALKNVRRRRLV